MSEQRTADTRGPGAAGPVKRDHVLVRLLSAVSLYVNQILDELRKVVRPTQSELVTYTSVVIAFVVTMMFLVFGLDSVFTKLVFWVFAGSGS